MVWQPISWSEYAMWNQRTGGYNAEYGYFFPTDDTILIQASGWGISGDEMDSASINYDNYAGSGPSGVTLTIRDHYGNAISQVDNYQSGQLITNLDYVVAPGGAAGDYLRPDSGCDNPLESPNYDPGDWEDTAPRNFWGVTSLAFMHICCPGSATPGYFFLGYNSSGEESVFHMSPSNVTTEIGNPLGTTESRIMKLHASKDYENYLWIVIRAGEDSTPENRGQIWLHNGTSWSQKGSFNDPPMLGSGTHYCYYEFLWFTIDKGSGVEWLYINATTHAQVYRVKSDSTASMDFIPQTSRFTPYNQTGVDTHDFGIIDNQSTMGIDAPVSDVTEYHWIAKVYLSGYYMAWFDPVTEQWWTAGFNWGVEIPGYSIRGLRIINGKVLIGGYNEIKIIYATDWSVSKTVVNVTNLSYYSGISQYGSLKVSSNNKAIIFGESSDYDDIWGSGSRWSLYEIDMSDGSHVVLPTFADFGSWVIKTGPLYTDGLSVISSHGWIRWEDPWTAAETDCPGIVFSLIDTIMFGAYELELTGMTGHNLTEIYFAMRPFLDAHRCYHDIVPTDESYRLYQNHVLAMDD